MNQHPLPAYVNLPYSAITAVPTSCNITLSYNQPSERLLFITSTWDTVPVSLIMHFMPLHFLIHIFSHQCGSIVGGSKYSLSLMHVRDIHMYQPQSIKHRLQVTPFQCPAQVLLSPFDFFCSAVICNCTLSYKSCVNIWWYHLTLADACCTKNDTCTLFSVCTRSD